MKEGNIWELLVSRVAV